MDTFLVMLVMLGILTSVGPIFLVWYVVLLHNKRRFHERDLQAHGGTICISGMDPIHVMPNAEVKVGFASIRIRYNGVERRIEINGWTPVYVEVSYDEYR